MTNNLLIIDTPDVLNVFAIKYNVNYNSMAYNEVITEIISYSKQKIYNINGDVNEALSNIYRIANVKTDEDSVELYKLIEHLSNIITTHLILENKLDYVVDHIATDYNKIVFNIYRLP